MAIGAGQRTAEPRCASMFDFPAFAAYEAGRAYAVAQAAHVRRGGRVAEGGGLLNRYRV